MKTKLLLAGIILALSFSARATLYTYNYTSGFNNSGVIPDGNQGGWSDTRTISGIPFLQPADVDHTSTIVDVNVRLNISGGYNGDLYGYLVHSSGFTLLLNRIGRTSTDPFGNSGAGMNVTLDDQNGTDIHGASYTVLSGTYHPDGRQVDPATVLDTDIRQNSGNPLAAMNGLDANGTWTLFLSDTASGDTSTLVSWGLDIEVVPEPTTWALIVFGVIAVVASLYRWLSRPMVTG